MQELGQIVEIWWKSGEIFERWTSTCCAMEEWQVWMFYKWAALLFFKTDQSKNWKIEFVYFDLKSDLKTEYYWTELYEQKFMWESHGKWTWNGLSMWIQANINFSKSKHHTSNCMKGKNYVFGGSSGLLKEGERRSRLASSLCGSFSITTTNYISNLKQEQLI